MRAHDWSSSPLGEPQTWPQSLRSVVGLLLNSKFPMFVAWGAQLGFLYNDPYAAILGTKHPQALGRRFHDIWAEIWPDISPLIDAAMSGEAIYRKDLPLVMNRKGFDEQTWFTFSYSPVRDESGRVSGMFCACTETTQGVIAERRKEFRLELDARLRNVALADEVTAVAAETLGRAQRVARVGYGEIDAAQEHVVVARDWTDGSIGSVVGRHRMDNFGPSIIAELKAGRVMSVDDVTTDPRVADAGAAFAAINTRSVLAVPLVKAGRFTAMLFLHHPTPRRWTDDDATLANDVAERTWAAVERARAEAALRESEARFRRIFEESNDFIFTADLQQRLTSCNPAAAAALGYPAEQLIGRSIGEFLAPQQFAIGQAMLAQKLREGGSTRYELVVKTAAAVERRWQVNSQLTLAADGSPAGVHAIARDVTEEHERGEVLRESERRFREMTDRAPIVVWVTAPDGTCTYLNLRWYEYTGQSRESALGFGWLDATHPQDRAAAESAFLAANARQEPFQLEYRLRRYDGQYRWAIDAAAPRVDDTGKFAGYIGCVVDIHDRKIAEDALRLADRQKDEFLAMLAHELRNPMAPIRTAAALLDRALPVDSPEHRMAGIIRRQAEQLARLVDDLLDVSRISQGRIELKREPLNLIEILERALETVEPLVRARRHQTHVTIAHGAPLLVSADPTRLTQCIGNILTNAAKYTPEGGSIRVDAREHDGHAVVAISDDGVGIATELLPHVFDLFVQADRTLDRSDGGLGIGLSVVRRLIEMHGGSVSARSAGLGQGSTFEIRLPLIAATDLHHENKIARGVVMPKRILIVDDNEDAAQSLQMLLEMNGHQAKAVCRPTEALSAAAEFGPEVALLDLGMPELNGYELARLLRQAPGLSNVVLVALTGYGRDEDRAKSAQAGFQAHLVKPVDLDQLEALLEARSAQSTSGHAATPSRLQQNGDGHG